MASYKYSGDARDLAKRAEAGMLPIFQAQKGFKAYSLAESDGEILSFSVWDSADDAHAASGAASQWTAENMAGEIELTDTRVGELLLSSALGVKP
jgi:heme-degrading monooxygenase HmoA